MNVPKEVLFCIPITDEFSLKIIGEPSDSSLAAKLCLNSKFDPFISIMLPFL